jgi:predicted AAA+ superfamily ATPase
LSPYCVVVGKGHAATVLQWNYKKTRLNAGIEPLQNPEMIRIAQMKASQQQRDLLIQNQNATIAQLE